MVRKYNMHSKDHLSRPSSRYNKKGKCIYNYPIPLSPVTTVNESGRVIYKQTTEEDRWVVSYMPALTKLMDCHVNVDVCFTVRSEERRVGKECRSRWSEYK